jgi:hydroxymethylglutaryl-CoA reductase
MNHRLDGFSKLSRVARIKVLLELELIDSQDAAQLEELNSPPAELAEHFIENVIGYFQVPLGVVPHFRIDGRDYVIPMAVEETSIIAAASHTAKWLKNSGEITTEQVSHQIIGQIQIAKCLDSENAIQKINDSKMSLIEFANGSIVPRMKARGGGVTDIELRQIKRPDGGTMVVAHVLMNPKNAMGANLMNQVCEGLRSPIQELTGERVTMCILSNLTDTKMTRAKVRIFKIDPALGEGISEASLFAQLDPYRAATNNKGVLNGIDAVLVATGNDWRAVEAGCHAFSARSGQYSSLTKWYMEGQDLIGEIELPLALGTVGGVTRLHPTANMCLKMLGTESSESLARIVAAVGLVQNLGALKALSTVGIVEGHMKLHASNLALAAGAEPREINELRRQLEDILKVNRRVTLSDAVRMLEQTRDQKGAHHV